MKNIILIGPPGAGKGTLAKQLVQKENLIHISTGDLIRDEQKKKSSIGEIATRLIDAGNFLPDEIVITMVKQKIIENPDSAGFIFDGFPRTVDQAKILDNFLIQRKAPIGNIIIMEISEDVMKKRSAIRAEIEGRPDDTPEVLKTRIENFKQQTMPVIEYYKHGHLFTSNRNKNINIIDASKTIEEVFADVETIF